MDLIVVYCINSKCLLVWASFSNLATRCGSLTLKLTPEKGVAVKARTQRLLLRTFAATLADRLAEVRPACWVVLALLASMVPVPRTLSTADEGEEGIQYHLKARR